MSRVFDLSGPEGNVFQIAAIAQSWNRQIGNDRPGLLEATRARLNAEADDSWSPKDANGGTYEDALDQFDLWFKGKIDYQFVNDPRNPDPEVDDEDDWV